MNKIEETIVNSEIKERRKAERYAYDPPEFITVVFMLGKDSGKEQIWELTVLDCSKHGMRLLVTDVDYDLLKMLKPGDVIKNITFYGKSTLIRVDATIRHITKIGHGPYKGQHLIGLESSDVLTSCMPDIRGEEYL
jgi:hypothetical protein